MYCIILYVYVNALSLPVQVKLLLDWEQTYINYRSLELPTTVSPNSPRGQHDGGGGSSHFWQWFVDAVFSLKDDLYDISTIKTLLYPEEVCTISSGFHLQGGGQGEASRIILHSPSPPKINISILYYMYIICHFTTHCGLPT